MLARTCRVGEPGAAGRRANWRSHRGERTAAPPEIRNRLVMRPGDFTSGHLPKGNTDMIRKDAGHECSLQCVSQQTEHKTEERMLLNCGVGEDSQESLGLQGDPTSPF